MIKSQVFDENLKLELKESLIIKNNIIDNFIELPDDLIKDFAITEET